MSGERGGRHYVKAPACPHTSGRFRPSYQEWRARIQALRPGEGLAYHQDGETRDPGAFAAAWDEAHQERPTVTLTQRRVDGRLVYMAVRR